jgi:hypothetical protein
MHVWIVQGFIVESKGINIKWVKVVESTIKEKAFRDDIKSNGHLGVVNREQTLNISESGGSMIPNIEIRVSQLALDNPRLEDVYFAPLEDDMGQSSYTMSKCPSGVLVENIQKKFKLVDLKKMLCILCKSKIKLLKVDENIVTKKEGSNLQPTPSNPWCYTTYQTLI